jgi:hypothetical protein
MIPRLPDPAHPPASAEAAPPPQDAAVAPAAARAPAPRIRHGAEAPAEAPPAPGVARAPLHFPRRDEARGAPAPASVPGGAARLETLRRFASEARAASRLDLDGACALAAPDGPDAARTYAAALFRTLGQALGRPPRLHAPGTAETSFDERWLTRLLERIEAGDEPSTTFLLCARVAPARRRPTAFLLRGLARRLEAL